MYEYGMIPEPRIGPDPPRVRQGLGVVARGYS